MMLQVTLYTQMVTFLSMFSRLTVEHEGQFTFWIQSRLQS